MSARTIDPKTASYRTIRAAVVSGKLPNATALKALRKRAKARRKSFGEVTPRLEAALAACEGGKWEEARLAREKAKAKAAKKKAKAKAKAPKGKGKGKAKSEAPKAKAKSTTKAKAKAPKAEAKAKAPKATKAKTKAPKGFRKQVKKATRKGGLEGYRSLQNLAKQAGLGARGSREALVEALTGHDWFAR